jgi:hypothetical protein
MKKLSVFLCAMGVLFGFGVNVHAFSNNEYSRETLSELTSSRILVHVVHHGEKSIEPFKSEITEHLKINLRYCGIHVNQSSNNRVELNINITEVPKESENLMYIIEIAVFQKGRLTRNEKSGVHDVCTWSSGYYGLCHSLTKIKEKVKDQIDILVDAHQSVNP